MIFTLTATTSSNRPNSLNSVEERALGASENRVSTSNGSPSRETTSRSQNCENRQSVHGIVASLIRAAEETRYKALDRPLSFQARRLSTNQNVLLQQDVGTQTSPVLLSRSSSFDWINEPTDSSEFDLTPRPFFTNSQLSTSQPKFSALHQTNLQTNSSCIYSSSPKAVSSVPHSTRSTPSRSTHSEQVGDTVNEEIENMFKRSEKIRMQVMEERKLRANQDIDESIAMLLGYAEDLTLRPHHTSSRNCINSERSKLSGELRSKKEKAENSPTITHCTSHFAYVNDKISTATTPEKSSFNGGAPNQSNGLCAGSSMMSDSIYDNVQGLRRGFPFSGTENELIYSCDTTEGQNSGQIDVAAARSFEVASSSSLPARDISICSGLLADSESSPSSPPPHFLPEKKGEKKSVRNISSSAIRRRSKIAPAEVKAAHCMERSNATNEVCTPSAPSPQLASEKLQSLPIAATDAALIVRNSKLIQRAGSCEELNIQRDQQEDEVFIMKKQKAEEEAIEYCRWLRDAGFPQYARLYEEHKFPIDIRSVQRDHEFLDADSLLALFRRLQGLNRCAIMKVENVVLRKRNEQFGSRLLEFDDSDMVTSNCDDDEDQCALSQAWKYQRKSHTWSRIVGEGSSTAGRGPKFSTIKKDELVEYQKWRNNEGRTSRGITRAKVSRGYSQEGTCKDDNQSHETAAVSSSKNESKKSTKNRSLQRSQSERIKERARALMKRMDIRSSSRRRKQRQGAEQTSDAHEMVIGQPVLVSHYSATPHSMRIYPDNLLNSKTFRTGNVAVGSGQFSSDDRLTDDALSAVQQSDLHHSYVSPSLHRNQSESAAVHPNNLFLRVGRPRSSSRRRMGMVILTPESPAEQNFLDPSPVSTNTHLQTYNAFPSTTFGYSNEDSNDSRIYDRVADDRFLEKHKLHKMKNQNVYSDYDRLDAADRFLSSNINLGDLLPYSEEYPKTETNCMITSNRNLIYNNICSTPKTDKINAKDIRIPTTQQWTPSSSQQACTLTGHSFMRSEGQLHGHIPGPTSSSPEATVNRQLNSKVGSSLINHNILGTASPGSSSYVGSVSSLANRLKIDIDIHNKHMGSSVSPVSALYSNSAERSPSSLESSGNDDEARHDSTVGERRDSGVGSSLSRSPSGPTTQRQRASLLVPIHSNNNSLTLRDFKKKAPVSLTFSPAISRNDEVETFMNDEDLLHCMDALSSEEMLRVRKIAFLRLSALIEKYAGSGIRIGSGSSSNSGTVKNWAVQKFRRKLRNSDLKPSKDFSIFGLSLTTVQSLTGLVLPRSILEIMQFLRTAASDTIGIFRKNGVRSRIMELRTMCNVSPGDEVFPNGKGLDLSQVHDIADMLKQYFRELPEPLMTAKYSDVFANIFLYVPKNIRSEALQHALLLLPDENREALQTLLFFLHDIAKHSTINNMNSQNLAVCFAPSLFHLGVSRLNAISSTSRHKTIGAAGMPTEREMKESRAAQECLVQMIDDCVKLFITPSIDQTFDQDFDSSGLETDIISLTEVNSPDRSNLKSYLLQSSNELLKEHRDRWKGWYIEGIINGIEVSSKKSVDGNSLRYFRVWVDVEAPPKEILTRIVRERNVWDRQTINWRTLHSSANENCDVFQYVINDTPSHPTRDVIVMRLWRIDIKDLRGGCTLVEKSVHSRESHLLGGIPATVFSSRFLVEPNSGRSRVTYISRVDLRGRSSIWYRKVYGNLLARQMAQLRDSFRQLNRSVDGPETKI